MRKSFSQKGSRSFIIGFDVFMQFKICSCLSVCFAAPIVTACRSLICITIWMLIYIISSTNKVVIDRFVSFRVFWQKRGFFVSVRMILLNPLMRYRYMVSVNFKKLTWHQCYGIEKSIKAIHQQIRKLTGSGHIAMILWSLYPQKSGEKIPLPNLKNIK